MSIMKLGSLVTALVILFVLMFSAGSLVEVLDNSEVMVIQSLMSGKLTWYTTPGPKWQGLGKVTKYEKRAQFWFSNKERDANTPAIETLFNDGARARIDGSFSWDMPTDLENLNEIHTKYASQHWVEQELLKTLINKTVYMTGPLMSSAESYASRRNELLSAINDQMISGVYRTTAADEKVKDPMTGQEKTVRVVKLVKDSDGKPAREDKSPLQDFGIKIYNLTFDRIEYDKQVEDQIQAQQRAVMEVQTAIANAKRAEQDAITAARNGEAEATKAKWAQEVIKATEVTKAEQEKQVAETQASQRKNVAALDLETAKLTKDAQIALGQGEAERKKLVMEADGALELKARTWLEGQKVWASAVSGYKGNWVPTVQSGSSSGGANGALDLIELLTAKTAKDLALDMSLPQPAAAK